MLSIFKLKVCDKIYDGNIRQSQHQVPAFPIRPCTASVPESLGAQANNGLETFSNWITEVDRALDNLTKSGKLFTAPSRRESMPLMGGQRPYPEFGLS